MRIGSISSFDELLELGQEKIENSENREVIKKILLEAQSAASNTIQFLKLAEIIYTVGIYDQDFDSPIDQAERSANSPNDWLECADFYKKSETNTYFSGEKESYIHRCITNAIERSEDGEELIICAYKLNILKMESNNVWGHGVKAALYKAEEKSVRAMELIKCAIAWKNIYLNYHKDDKCIVDVVRCLSEAENMSLDSKDWIECANAWKEHVFNYMDCYIRFDEDNKHMNDVLRCLSEAENVAIDSHDWFNCANAQKRLAGNQEAYLADCEKALEVFCFKTNKISGFRYLKDYAYDNMTGENNSAAVMFLDDFELLNECLDFYLVYNKNLRKALGFMKKVEGIADTFANKIIVAFLWKNRLKLEDGIEKTYENAVKNANSFEFSSQYLMCALLSQYIYPDDKEKILNYLLEAKSKALDYHDWIDIAICASKLLGTQKESIQALKKGAALIDKSDANNPFYVKCKEILGLPEETDNKAVLEKIASIEIDQDSTESPVREIGFGKLPDNSGTLHAGIDRAYRGGIGFFGFKAAGYDNTHEENSLLADPTEVTGIEKIDLNDIKKRKKHNSSKKREESNPRDFETYVFSEVEEIALECLLGNSSKMKEVKYLICKFAAKEDNLLILGETGTGKEVVADALYKLNRPNNKFIKTNAANISEELFESELFGHEKGAFSSAIAQRIGKVEEAGEGTILIDEFATLSPKGQDKLLRLLGEKEYSRLGSNTVKKTPARIICATNGDIKKLVAENKLRSDIPPRFTYTITLPPLRERKEDIAILIDHFLSETDIKLHPEAMNRLMNLSWRENVRGLKNVAENIKAFFNNGKLVDIDSLENILEQMNILPDETFVVEFENRSKAEEFLDMHEELLNETFRNNDFTQKEFSDEFPLSQKTRKTPGINKGMAVGTFQGYLNKYAKDIVKALEKSPESWPQTRKRCVWIRNISKKRNVF